MNSLSSFRDFFEKEFKKSIYFKIEKKDLIYQHITKTINLNENKDYLQTNKLKELQLNENLKITQDVLDVFDITTLKNEDPIKILSNLFHKIRTQEYKSNEIEHFKKIGVNYFRLQSSCDDKTCVGCSTLSSRIFSVNDDINEILDHTCTSSYCRCYLKEIADDEEAVENVSLSKKQRKDRYKSNNSGSLKIIIIIILIIYLIYFISNNA